MNEAMRSHVLLRHLVHVITQIQITMYSGRLHCRQMRKIRSHSRTLGWKVKKTWRMLTYSFNQGDETHPAVCLSSRLTSWKIQHYAYVVCSFYPNSYQFPLTTGRKQNSIEKALHFLPKIYWSAPAIVKDIPAYGKYIVLYWVEIF